MTTLLLSLLTSKVAIGIGAVFIAIVGAFMRGRISGGQREREKQKAKEADAYEQHLEEIASAARARDSVTGGLPDRDPYRRD